MLQIKTIGYRLDNADDFDKEVNAALAEGWQLTKREVLQPKAQSERVQTHIMLYAALERTVITEAERGCENCAHSNLRGDQEPCRSCEDGEIAPTNWESKE